MARHRPARCKRNAYPRAPHANETNKGGATSRPTPGHTSQPPAEKGGNAATPPPSYPPPSPQPAPKHTHAEPKPSRRKPGAAGINPHTTQAPAGAGSGQAKTQNPDTYQTRNPKQEEPGEGKPQNQARAPHDGREPSVHSPGTEAACAMQVTRPNVTRSPGVRLHPKACATLGLGAERATPKHLGSEVPRTCMHALGTGYARKSGEPLGFRSKERTCAGVGAHPPSVTNTSRWRRSALPVLPGAA